MDMIEAFACSIESRVVESYGGYIQRNFEVNLPNGRTDEEAEARRAREESEKRREEARELKIP